MTRLSDIKRRNSVVFDSYGDVRIVWIILGFALALIALIVSIIIGTIALNRHYGRIACRNWATNAQRETKFRVLQPLDGGTCFTLQLNGKWVPIDQVREMQP